MIEIDFSSGEKRLFPICVFIKTQYEWSIDREPEVIAFGNKDEVLKVNAYLNSRGQTTRNQVKNLDVILESDLSFSRHVKAKTKPAYYHLKNFARNVLHLVKT